MKTSFATRVAGLIAMACCLAAPLANSQVHEWRTMAGHPGGGGFRDGIGENARFLQPRALAFDIEGNLVVGDMVNNAIRTVSTWRTVTTIARSQEGAIFGWISDLGTDAAGNIYALDQTYRNILRISPAGEVEPLQFETSPGLSSPQGIEVLPDGTCFIADHLNHRIVKIPPGGEAITFAGLKSVPGNDDGQGSSARFRNPSDIKLGPDGFLYVMDSGNLSIRKIDLTGNVGHLSFVPNYVERLEIAADGTFYLTGTHVHDILTVSPTLQIASLPCVDEGTGQPSNLVRVSRVRLDGNGNLFISEPELNRIRKRSPAGVVSFYAGSPTFSGSENGFGPEAGFHGPAGVASDAGGALYVADQDNHLIRKILVTGEVTTFAGGAGQPGTADGNPATARFREPGAVAVDQLGRVLVADTMNHAIRRILPDGTVETLAGSPGTEGFTNGTGNAALFRHPRGIAIDAEGNAYVADHSNNWIRKVTPEGVVTSPWNVDQPMGVAVDGGGNLYVTSYDHCLRKMTPEGVKTVLAGVPGSVGSNNGPGNFARFFYPAGLALGPSGDLFVADMLNHRIRVVTPEGVVSTIGGTSNYGGNSDGRGDEAVFNFPMGIAVSPTGDAIVCDTGNHRIVRGISVGEPELRFGEWAAASGLTGEEADSEASPFGDGVANLLKYAFNLDGSEADARYLNPGTGTAGLPDIRRTDGFSGEVLRVEYLRRIGSGLRYEPLRTTDFLNFLPLTGPETVTPVSAGWERVVVEEHPGPSGGKRLFLKLSVTTW